MSRTSHARLVKAFLGALSGLLAAAAGLLAAEGVTALLSGVTSPFLAVGNRAVEMTPGSLKDFAVRTFGTADKSVLIAGIGVVIAVLAAVAGELGTTRRRTAYLVFALLTLVASVASLTDRSATAPWLPRLVPCLALALVALGSLHWLLGVAAGSTMQPSSPAASGPTLDRRGFLRAVVVVAGVAVAGAAVARQLGGSAAAAARAALRLPKAASPVKPIASGELLHVPGLTSFVTPNPSFYRVDTALRVPDVPIDGWSLRVHGLVDHPREYSFADLLRRPLIEKRITLTCVSNPVGGHYAGNAVWLGIPVHQLLAEAGVRSGADAIKSTSADGFTVGTPLSALDDPSVGALVAIGMNGEPLPLAHGFPARLVTPGLYGYVSATKWLVDLEVTRFADFKAYWTTKGYDALAPIKTESRIDVPGSFAHVAAGRVTIAGVAWAQGRGVSKVEVRADGGAWHDARLAGEDDVDCWRQWVWQWKAPPGNHTLEVRATDRTGYTQTEHRADVAPNGATGWHSVNVTAS